MAAGRASSSLAGGSGSDTDLLDPHLERLAAASTVRFLARRYVRPTDSGCDSVGMSTQRHPVGAAAGSAGCHMAGTASGGRRGPESSSCPLGLPPTPWKRSCHPGSAANGGRQCGVLAPPRRGLMSYRTMRRAVHVVGVAVDHGGREGACGGGGAERSCE